MASKTSAEMDTIHTVNFYLTRDSITILIMQNFKRTDNFTKDNF